MKVTNSKSHPWYIAMYLLQDDYDLIEGGYSATSLLKPARSSALIANLGSTDSLSYDIDDLTSASYGTSIHSSMSRVLNSFKDGTYDKKTLQSICGDSIMSVEIIEERYFCEVDGYKVHGKPDAVINGVLHDFKSTTSYKWNDANEDYVKQLSIYRYILEKNGIFLPCMAVIDFFFTDWKRSDALRGNDYPQSRFRSKRIHLMTSSATEDYIRSRIKAIEDAKVELPLCTSVELWQKPDRWAHMRKNRKSAVRLYDSEEEAIKAVEVDEKPSFVEKRPGEVRACLYCRARSICEQYSNMINDGTIK